MNTTIQKLWQKPAVRYTVYAGAIALSAYIVYRRYKTGRRHNPDDKLSLGKILGLLTAIPFVPPL